MLNLDLRRLRWIILAVVFCTLLLNYFDRQIVSVLKPTLKSEFSIDDDGYMWIVNVFMICYAISYPIAGWLVDRFGARVMMMLAVIGWSGASIGAGVSHTFGRFLFFRGMLGVAEPAAYPAQVRIVAKWFPSKLRATANSICQAGSSIGSILAPILVSWMALRFSWNAAFIIPGVVGLFVALAWWFIYRDPPADFVLEEEAKSEETAPQPEQAAFTWPQILRTRTLWGIVLCRFISDPVWYFCLFWLHGYIQENLGVKLSELGWVGWIPFLAADLGAIGTSAWSDRMVRRGKEPLRARKYMLTAVACLAPLCILIPYFSQLAVVLTIFSIIAIMCLSWLFTTCVVVAETFPTANVGGVLGIACGFGAFGFIIFNTFVGEVMTNVGAAPIFIVMAFLHPLATILLWAMVRRERPSKHAE